MKFDPKMKLTDIWIDFNIGQIHCDELGRHTYKVFLKERTVLAAEDISEPTKHIKILGKMLKVLLIEAEAKIRHIRDFGVPYEIVEGE